jgi:N-acetylneuraminate synthase
MSSRTYVIAEAGVNHDGSVEDALRLIDAAAEAGADCVKFQAFKADALVTADADKAGYQKRTTSTSETQLTMLQQLELPASAFHQLRDHAKSRHIDFLVTPFDLASVEYLIGDLRLKRIKIGSGDMNNAPMLLVVATAGCEVILSTGMATLAEVEEALSVLAFGYANLGEPPSQRAFAAAWRQPETRATLKDKVVLLHCTTEYPAAPESVNLRAIETLRTEFGLSCGFSDHTLGICITIAAVGRGAAMLEKHLTLSRTRNGPDHAASLEPKEFRDMVDAIRTVEKAIGDGRKVPQAAEIENISIVRKSLVAARAIKKGEIFNAENLTLKRPAGGLPPLVYWDVIGKVAQRHYDANEKIEP